MSPLRYNTHRLLAERGLCLLIILISAATLVHAQTNAGSSSAPTRSTVNPPGSDALFVDNAVCAGCHAAQHEAWTTSHHHRAMARADEQTVLGDFADARFTHRGLESRFFRRDGKFFVNTQGPDGKPADFEIVYTFGIEPLQQYLVEFPGGRLQSLTIAWDTKERRWFHLYPGENITADDPLHWTGRYQNWNGMCAECHSTNLQKNYDPEADAYQTTWSEINVSCQACHGPGSDHVAWARTGKAGEKIGGDGNGLIVDFQAHDSRYQVDTCARCHSRRRQLSAADAHGRQLLDDFLPSLLREDLYHADGQILDEVYVYGSFLQSKMYAAGVRCTDCHDAHNARLKAPGNELCVQCHQPHNNRRFATLKAGHYDSTAHHFHPEGSAGAQCVNCHMPAKTYMVVDPRRDHSFRIPRPDLSVKLGTPNACTGCHDDQSNDWAAEKIAEWYGPERRRERHYGEAIAAGRAGKPGAQKGLIAVVGDRQQPAIVRATALDLLSPSDPTASRVILDAASDENPLLRATAVRRLAALPPDTRFDALARLLKDPVRAVRTEAARTLASAPASRFSSGERGAFVTALDEYREAQLATSDVMPGAHLNLAVLDTSLGEPEAAEKRYRSAIALDPDFLPARINLANLYNTMRRNPEAEQVLRDAIARAPDEGELHYSLGLLLAEEQRLEDAAGALGKAAELLPERARVHYNYGLALQHLGRAAKAESALHAAHNLDRDNPEILRALVIFYSQQRRWRDAHPYAERLVSLYPNAPEPRRMLERLETLQKYDKK